MSKFSLAEISAIEDEKLNAEADKIRAEAEKRKAQRIEAFENERRNAQGLQPLSAAGIGAASSVESLGHGLKFAGAETLGEAVEGFGAGIREDLQGNLSDRSKEALNTPLTVADEASVIGASLNPDAGLDDFFMAAMQGAGSAASSIAMGGPVSAAGKKTVSAGMGWMTRRMSREAKALIKKGADPKSAADVVLSRYKVGKFSVPDAVATTAGAVGGYGTMGGLMEGGGSAAEVEQTILQMDSKQLNELERFREIYHLETDDALSDEQRHQIARVMLAKEESDRTFDDMFTKGMVAGSISGPILERAMIGRSASGSRALAGGMASEGIEEGYIGGESQRNVNIATERPEDEGVAHARVEGAVHGAMGGGMASAPNASVKMADNVLNGAAKAEQNVEIEARRQKQLDTINGLREQSGLAPMHSMTEFEERFRVVPGVEEGEPFLIYDTEQQKVVGRKDEESKALWSAKEQNLQHNITRGDAVPQEPVEAEPVESVPEEVVEPAAEESPIEEKPRVEPVERGEVYNTAGPRPTAQTIEAALAERDERKKGKSLHPKKLTNTTSKMVVFKDGSTASMWEIENMLDELEAQGTDEAREQALQLRSRLMGFGAEVVDAPVIEEPESVEVDQGPQESLDFEAAAAEEVAEPETVMTTDLPRLSAKDYVRISKKRGDAVEEAEKRGINTDNATVAEIIDAIEQFEAGQDVVRAGSGKKMTDPRKRFNKKPLHDWIKKRGGVDPESPVGRELKGLDISYPGFFSKGGMKSLDGIVQEEHEIFDALAPPEDVNGYVDELTLVDILEREQGGEPLLSNAQREAVARYEESLRDSERQERAAEAESAEQEYNQQLNAEDIDRTIHGEDWEDEARSLADLYQKAAKYDAAGADRHMSNPRLTPFAVMNQLEGIIAIHEDNSDGADTTRTEGDGAGKGGSASAEGEVSGEIRLESQTEEELQQREEERQQQLKKQQAEEKGAEEREKADRETGSFELTGSDLPADANPGQGDMLSTAAHEAATSPENSLPEPSEAQKEAGNYKLGHHKLHGLDLSIENPKGSTRSGKDRDGKEWSIEMQSHYGYIKGTVGRDKDHVDLFLGDNAENPDLPVFVVDQVEPDSGKFDEHKVVMGAATEQEARDLYLANYEDGWQGIGGIKQMSLDDFKVWVKDPEQTKKRLTKSKKREESRTESPQQSGFDMPMEKSSTLDELRGKLEQMSYKVIKETAKGSGVPVGRRSRKKMIDSLVLAREAADTLRDYSTARAVKEAIGSGDIDPGKLFDWAEAVTPANKMKGLGPHNTDLVLSKVVSWGNGSGAFTLDATHAPSQEELDREAESSVKREKRELERLKSITPEYLAGIVDHTEVLPDGFIDQAVKVAKLMAARPAKDRKGAGEISGLVDRTVADIRSNRGSNKGIGREDVERGALSMWRTMFDLSDQEVSELEKIGGAAIRKGEVGMKLSAGEVVTTNTGREAMPFPKLDFTTERKSRNSVKRVDAWLMENAVEEARSRGDDFNLRQFESVANNPSPADKDSAEEYLFGDYIPPVIPPMTKPLTDGVRNKLNSSRSYRKSDRAMQSLAQKVSDKLLSGEKMDWRAFNVLADESFGGTQADGVYSPKDAYDAMEMGLNLAVLDIAGKDLPAGTYTEDHEVRQRAALNAYHELMELLPTQTRRTEEQNMLQQYSTPHTHGFVASWVANLQSGDVVLEPSAGTGNLATHALAAGVEPANIHVNELADRRNKLLRGLFENVTQENAEHLHAILPESVKPTVVIMNPPFSANVNKPKKKDILTGARHVMAALDRLEEGGRLVAILGRGMALDRAAAKGWWEKVMRGYNVRANVQISGDEYKKFGTTFDNQMVVIDKNGATADPEAIITGRVESVADLPGKLREIRNDRDTRSIRSPDQPTRREEAGADRVGTVAPDTGNGDGATQRREQAQQPSQGQGDGSADGDRDAGGGAVEPDGRARADGDDLGRGDSGTVAVNNAEESGRDAAGGDGESDVRGDSGTLKAADDTIGRGDSRDEAGGDDGSAATENGAKDQLTDASFARYRPSVSVAEAREHPAILGESAAMSAVDAPVANYQHSIDPAIIQKGNLSGAQLESIVRAGAAHERLLPSGERKGFALGDGTGVGKGAQIAGIIEDNRAKGRKKALWVSENAPLFKDAIRDTQWVGGSADQVFMQGKVKTGTSINLDEGTAYTTYATLSQKAKDGKPSRLDQMVEWLGEDFDGVIAFDEAHNMANNVDQKGSRGTKKASSTALAAIDLQKRLPNARVVYVSATAATEVNNLGYAERLGLWGEGTAFADKGTFISEIESGGIAAMEVVAKDMKASGSYLARSIMFDGVEYDTLVHPLSGDQREVFDTLARSWQLVLNNIDEAMGVAGSDGDGRYRSRVLSNFWSSHQRFASQILTSMQMPSVINDVEAQLEAGHSAVLQLVNTNEATQERRLDQAKAAGIPLEEVDITPRDILMQFVENGFPTTQFEEYLDEEGNERSRPVKDSEGNVVENPAAVQMKNSLLMKIAELQVPEGPLEQLINHFGSDAVAEITGRKRRLVRKPDESVVIETLGRARSEKDANDFNEGKKRILVFSDAGGTGRSYHASREVKNQQRRIHYLIQPGWRADKAVQGFGRTHRTNQASAPVYRLVTTDLKAQGRFIATIAKRLGQLGALTKGQRDSNSQGMFSEDMDLDNEYGSAALRTLLRDLMGGRVEGVTLQDFMQQTALNFIDKETGEVVESKLPTVSQFLNRTLSMEIDTMNRLFKEFTDRIEAAVSHAKEQGTYNQGMETIKADAIRKQEDQAVGGGGTRYVKVETENPAHHVQFEQLPSDAEFYRHNTSGKLYAFVGALNVTDTKSGRIVQRKRRISPSGGDYVKLEEFQGKYGPDMGSQQEHAQEWADDLAELSPIRKSTIHMIVGELLPIWDRLPDAQPRIYRMQTDDGEVLLGRVIPNKELSKTLTALGLESKVESRTPAEWLEQVVKQGSTIELANGWKITRRRVSDQWRMELMGASPAEAGMIEKMGGFREIISFQPRTFLPANDAEVLGRVLKNAPVVGMDEDNPSFSRRAEENLSGVIQRSTDPEDQKYAAILNNAMVKYGLGQHWSGAYEAVELPDALSGVRKAFQTAFGGDIRAVVPTSEEFNIFSGVRLSGREGNLFVNLKTDTGFIQVAGHEFLHELKGKRPDLYEHLATALDQYGQNLQGYQDKLNALIQEGEAEYDRVAAKEELLGDITGDALADPKFLQQLAEDNPSRFKKLLQSVLQFFNRVSRKLRGKGLGSSEYLTDVDAMRQHLRVALNAFGEGQSVEEAVDRLSFMTAWHGSPHNHNRFSTEHIGSGEGNQAYGWGLYFAENKKVAQWYRKVLSEVDSGRVQFNGNNFDLNEDEESIVATIVDRGYHRLEAADAVDVLQRHGLIKARQQYNEYHDAMPSWKPSDTFNSEGLSISNNTKVARILFHEMQPINSKGKLYKVDLKPLDDEYLLWDKSLSEQSEKVQAAIHPVLLERGFEQRQIDSMLQADNDGQSLYSTIASMYGEKEASMLLRRHGIRGVQYLDGNSRKKGEGNHNYVIFDGADVEIEAKFSRNPKSKKGADGEQIRDWKESKVQLHANMLSNFLRDDIGVKNGFRQVDVPDNFAETARAIKESLGAEVVFVQPTAPEASGIFKGMHLPGGDTAYVSTEAQEVDFMSIAGHEFLHQLRDKKPELYDYLASKMRGYVDDEALAFYRKHINSNPNWSNFTTDEAREELLGDFVGHALNDPAFVAQLAEDNPGKFKSLLESLLQFFNRVARKLKKGRYDNSATYFNDVDAMRKHLRVVIDAHVNNRRIDSVWPERGKAKPSLAGEVPIRNKGDYIRDANRKRKTINGMGQGVIENMKRNGVTWKTIKDMLRPGMLWGMTGKQILEVYGGKLRGSLKKYTHQLDQMREEKSKLINRADGIEKRWSRHADATEIGEILLEGTYNQLDPKMGFDDHAHVQKRRDRLHEMTADARLMNEMNPRRESLEREIAELEGELADLKETHEMLVDRYRSLTGSGKRIYNEVRNTYSEGLEEYKRALVEKIRRSEMSGKAKMAARKQVELMFVEMADLVAYFPLKRFGENIVEAEIDGERHFMKFDRVADAEAEKQRIIDEGGIAERFTEAEYVKSDSVVAPQFMADVESMLEGNGLMDQGLRDSLNQLYLNYLPESSARKQFMHRKYVKGFSRDAIRAFSHSMFHGAHHMAKIKFADQMQKELQRMEQMTNRYTYRVFAGEDRLDEVGSYSTEVEAREARVAMMEQFPEGSFTIKREANPDLASDMKDSESLAQVVNHMKKRHDALMNPSGSRIVNAMSGAGFVMYLGFTPAAAMVNMSQTGLVAMPQLAARHGWSRAQSALHRYVKDIAVSGHINSVDEIEVDEIMTEERKAELKRIIDGRRETRVIDKTLRTLLTRDRLNNRQRVALMHLYDSGNLDLSQNSDLSSVAHNDLGVRMGGAVPLKGVVEASGYLFHNVEVFNREVTGLAAYDLTYEDAIEAGLSEAEAHNRASEAAVEANDRGHFDYSTENRAMLMQGNVARVVTQFKQYSQNMTFRLLRDFHQTFQGESEEDRLIARRQLIGTLGMHAIFAGASGLPFVTLPMVLQIAGMAMGDEDEPVDGEVEFRNYLTDTFGQKGAEVIMNGVLRGIPGISAADVSSRISLNGLWVRDSGWDKEGDSEVLEVMKMVMGPHASLWIENPIKAVNHFGNGDYYKGTESLSPKILKDVVKAIRNMNYGEMSKAGIVQMEAESFDWLDSSMQAAGFTPSRKANMYEHRNAVNEKKNVLERRRNNLKNRWVQAKRERDYSGVREAWGEIKAFNRANPELELTDRSLRRSLKGKVKRQEQTRNGVYLSKSREHLRDEGRFARVEGW